MASKMLHTCLRVENLEKSIAFYQDAFGFKELRRRDFPDHAFTIVYLGLEGDDYELELTYNYDHGPYVVGDGFAHIALSTPDLEALHQEHSAKGYEVTEPNGLPGTAPTITLSKTLMDIRSKSFVKNNLLKSSRMFVFYLTFFS